MVCFGNYSVNGYFLTRLSTEPVASPPPPYSPRRGQESGDSPRRVDAVSPSETVSPDTDPSRYNTPVSAATTISPDFSSRHFGIASPLPSQQSFPNDSPNLPAAPIFPPPPPTNGPGHRIRSTSKHHADRLLSSLASRAKGTNTVSPVNAIDALQESTAQALALAPEASNSDSAARPPASRRAASTGGIGISGPSVRSATRSPSQSGWEPGMPLPPPPPGPPPACARSQSLNRTSESPLSELPPVLPLRSRRPPGHGTTLDTVPPTPADWREESPAPRPGISNLPNGPAPLHIDTGSILRKGRSATTDPITAISATPQSSHHRRDSSSGALFRSPAVRNRSSMGIRERRSESRNGKGRELDEPSAVASSSTGMWPDDSNMVRPTDLVLPRNRDSLARRRHATKPSPGSAKNMMSLDDALHSTDTRLSSGQASSFGTSNSTPRPESTRTSKFPKTTTPTPPFSPGRDTFSNTSSRVPANLQKSLPTPPPQQLTEAQYPSYLGVPPTPEERPVSHLLHMPNPDESMQVPLTPLTKASSQPLADLLGPESPKAFAQRAIERHRNFAEREAAAADDSERLELFTQFVLAESRIRREQYAAVFEEDDIDVKDLMQGLFAEQQGPQASIDQQRPELEDTDSSRNRAISNVSAQGSTWRADSPATSQNQQSSLTSSCDSSPHNRPETTWWKDYIPSLSPIASMSIVTGQDEMDSRGRAPSRWWEDHSGESVHGDAFKVLERSKRESKYMGVPKEARNSPALYENGYSASSHCPGRQVGEASQQPMYRPDEYPPEKAGWHAEASTLPPPPAHPPTPQSAPYTPDPRRLDISRLVNLPPPYPRHHPAVNNNHPDLADERAVVRSLHDKDEAEGIRETYRSQILEKRKRADSLCQHQKSLHDQEIQFRMEHGEISQEQYDQAESELEAKMAQSEKVITQTDFDLFQNVVVTPLHAVFATRIAKATLSIERLSSRLFSDAQDHSPNLPQEEGDEQPELLEKLTQLKWLFEARESLHRFTYDLLTERNDKYKAVVLLPYKQSKNPTKLAEAESFFARDAQDRQVAFERAVVERTRAFLQVIEGNVVRGVEVQLSAFWDIAPSLLHLLQKIPSQDSLPTFQIQIPATEYAENPSYHTHPLQYLYSLLSHAEKSSYQFIESQINLLCLLHEIKNAELKARCLINGDGGSRREEESRLDEDLKEKVGVVEGLWGEALGEEMRGVRERVRGVLLEEGGWDEEEDDV